MNVSCIKSIGIIVLLGLSFLVGRYSNKPIIKKVNTEKIIIDTLILEKPVVDTITHIQYVEKYLPSTIIEKIDTIIKIDSIKVYVPINKYLFEEPNKYKIEVSGYNVSIDNIKLFPKTLYKTETKTIKLKPKFGVGIHIGYGICNSTISPYIGVGVNYNLITF